jgi:hypothetical protein
MKYWQFILAISFGSLLAWLGFSGIIWYLDPLASGALGFVLFYALLFLALGGTLSLVSLVIQYHFDKTTLASRQVARACRQGTWFACLFILHLLLLQFRILAWYTSLPLMLFFAAIEGWWQTTQASTHPETPQPKAS